MYDEDDAEEAGNWLMWAFLICVGLPIFLLYKGCTEFQYSFSGVTVEAVVTDVLMEVEVDTDAGTEEPTGRGLVKYSFRAEPAEEGSRAKSYHNELIVSLDELENYSMQQKIDVVYLPSRPETNVVVSHRQRFWMYLLAIITLALAGGMAWAIWRARKDVRRPGS